MTWKPKLRQIRFTNKPDFVPDWVYTEAMVAKRFYNAEWEFWVFQESLNYNCSIAKAEDACIRGIKKAFLRVYLVHGDRIGKWYEEFMEMGDIFEKVKHPEYLKQLDGVTT